MKIKMLKLSAGPSGVLRPGDTVEVSEREAALLIEGGYAASTKPHAKPAAHPEGEPAQKTETRVPTRARQRGKQTEELPEPQQDDETD